MTDRTEPSPLTNEPLQMNNSVLISVVLTNGDPHEAGRVAGVLATVLDANCSW